MRVLFTTHPGFGHFHPLVPLAKALQQAGHEVAFAAAASFQSVIAGNGLRGFTAGADWDVIGGTVEDVQKRQAAAGADLAARRASMAKLFIDQFGQRMLPDLLRISGEFAPDLIVRDSVEFAGCVAAEKLGIPHVSIQVGAGHPVGMRTPEIAVPLDALRAAAGLAADPSGAILYRYLHLIFAPPGYFAELPLPPTTHCFAPELFDRSGSETLPAWVDTLSARPLVYATLGTVFNKMFHPFSSIIKGLVDAPVELVVTVGRDLDPVALGPQPPHIHIERYIPQTMLFPRCAAAILHGGYNSVVSALCHGLPLVIVPLAADQPMNAERCQKLGVAQVIQPSELSPERVRTAVDTILSDPSYRQNAQRFQAAAQSLPGIQHAVALLARLAADKQPITQP